MVANIQKDKNLCQISLTGARALILLGLLIEEPRSLEEIRKKFIEYKLIDDTSSNDIIRIDLNTLKAMGCTITRADHNTNNKFKLLNHPFVLSLTKDEINLLKRSYNKIKNSLNIHELIDFELLFKKLSEHVNSEELKESLLGISTLKYFNLEYIKELEEDCKYNRTICLIYKSPTSKNQTEKEIVVQEVVFKNDKFYLYGYDLNLKEFVTLNIKRILKILYRKDGENNITSSHINVTFKLQGFGIDGLDENENIVSGNFNDGFIIKGEYHNEFVATQRLLSFGPCCTIIEPQEIREIVIESLKKMKEIYD